MLTEALQGSKGINQEYWSGRNSSNTIRGAFAAARGCSWTHNNSKLCIESVLHAPVFLRTIAGVHIRTSKGSTSQAKQQQYNQCCRTWLLMDKHFHAVQREYSMPLSSCEQLLVRTSGPPKGSASQCGSSISARA